MNREEWLTRAAHLMRPWFVEYNANIPTDVRVSIGFPSHLALSAKSPVVGQCWGPATSADGTTDILISPRLGDGIEIVATLAHELVHAAVGVQHGHKSPFARVARAIGLEGKMTATIPSDAFRERASGLLESLGPIPHSALMPSVQVRKQSTRMLKCWCDGCGYIVRVTAKWIEAAGAPICPTCKRQMGAPESIGE